MKKIQLLFLFTILYATQAVGQKLNESPLRKLQMAEFAISRLYVDSVNETKLVEDAIVGMLEHLDPHFALGNGEMGIFVIINTDTDNYFIDECQRTSYYRIVPDSKGVECPWKDCFGHKCVEYLKLSLLCLLRLPDCL